MYCEGVSTKSITTPFYSLPAILSASCADSNDDDDVVVMTVREMICQWTSVLHSHHLHLSSLLPVIEVTSYCEHNYISVV